ncbi:hypothetical protein GCM10027035_22890 [Emticicia sediminis]
MKTALFIMFASPSHYHATFSLATQLHEEGFNILYVGNSKIRQLVVDEGFDFLEWDYTIEYFIKSFKMFIFICIKTILDKRFVFQRYRDFYSNQLALEELIAKTQPSQIFIDEHLAEYAIFFKKYKSITTTILCTKLSSRKSKGVPPMNSYFKPSRNLYSELVCEYLWLQHWFVIHIKKNIQKIAFGCKNEEYFLKRFCVKNGTKLKNVIDQKNFFFVGIKDIPRIILGTPKLEVVWKQKFDNETYHFLPTKRNEERYKTNEYNTLITILENNRLPVIYCSFGTVSFKDLIRVQSFIEKLLKGVPKNINLILVISKGKINFSFPVVQNVYFFDYLPQLDFLKYCDVMITHGGHNSIKECLQSGVKMLVYPHMEDNDQPGNAMRVELNGYGLRGNLSKDSTEDIWCKILTLIKT